VKHDGFITELGVSFDRIYLKFLKSITLRNLPKTGFKIVYTPLHGTGSAFGATLLRNLGYEVYPVNKQMTMDPDFSTVRSPNPEDKQAFTLAEQLGKSIRAQLLLATDPDADRLGLAILNGHEYKYLSGATIGALLLDYIIQHQKELTNRVVITTIVTSPLGTSIAKYYGLKVIETLTGFKFIGEQIAKLENQQNFLFGYEESFGYLLSPEVRDKDAFQAMVIAAEMMNHYYRQGISIDELLHAIYEKYGYFKDSLLTFSASGQAGLEKIKLLMDSLRKTNRALLDIYEPLNIEDYEASIRTHHDGSLEQLTLPKSDVLKWNFKQGFVVFRPSGTEPKLKVYISVGASSETETDDKIKAIKKTIESFVRKMIYD
jgi:phosphoglucomutase